MSVKPANNLWRTGVKFRSLAEAVKTGIRQFIEFGGECRFVQTEIIREQIVERLLAGVVGGVFKNFRAKILREPNDFK